MGEALTDWIGREAVAEDVVSPVPARALAATLGHGADLLFAVGDALPPLWTWLYFLPLAPAAEVGSDGHPKRGGFLPPITLPRRMWAGSRCAFDAPVRIGDRLTRTSRILNVVEKSGKSGAMVFVTVGHEVHSGGALVFAEEQDIVYMPIPDVFAPPAPAQMPGADWSEPMPVDPVLLFRFSALTFNGHRIHYDRTYAMEAEKYPGLVVHGPLQAVALMAAAQRHAPGKTPERYEFRGMRPLFDFDSVSLNGVARNDGGVDLFSTNGDGAVGMKAIVQWRAEN